MTTTSTTRQFHALLERFNADLLMFPSYVAAFHELEGLLSLYRETGVSQNLLILGETGTGKTTICKDFVVRNPRVVLPERDVVPVLHVSIPPAATIAAVCEAILRKLGDPNPTLGTNSTKAARVTKLIRALSVELLLIDEAQHIQDRGKLSTQYQVGDWLKTLIDEVSIPTVLLGLPRLANILQVNEQLRRRFTRRRNLEMGQAGESSIEEECLQLFVSLGASLPLPLATSGINWKDMPQRVYFACDGRVAYIKKLLAGAIRIAVEQADSIIGLSVLEAAFTAEVWWEGIGPLNPFNGDFIFRRLNRAGEPFENGQILVRRSGHHGK